ncbi:MAG TPA: PilT/PilU family type 4a pilus ATPase [Kofleriaceae bacterium]|nr:PilT/PilU family type 4a pilus ATPase [Kofleriaceae bacterium]
MARIDVYLSNLVRLGASGVVLESDAQVLFKFAAGDRKANQTIAHRDLQALVEEIAPPDAQAALFAGRDTAFDHAYSGAKYRIAITPGASWTVSISARPERGPAGPESGGPAPPQEPQLLGRLAVHYKLITMDQLEEAIREQGRRGKPLGTILVELGLVSQQQLDKLLAAQQQYLDQPRRPRAATPAATYTPAATRLVTHTATPPSPLDTILARAIHAGASDVLVHPDALVKLRVHASLLDAADRLTAAQTEQALRAIAPPDLVAVLDKDGEIDFTYAIPDVGRFRTSIYRQHRGVSGVFHFVPPSPPTLESLGLPQDLAKVTTFPQGMVLVTGPAGCGKTSTLAALVNLINEERHDHILTIEDPVEYIHPSKRCLVNQRQVRRHTESFARALRAALREDPDVICIGELRDLETISLAMSAAETGHLVLATLHTNNAIRTINRIVGAFPSQQQGQIRTMLAESLRAVISQRLLPSASSNGMVAALEILHVNPAIGNLIRDQKTFQIASVLTTGRTRGQKALDHSLMELVQAGAITAEVAAQNSDNPAAFVKGAK